MGCGATRGALLVTSPGHGARTSQNSDARNSSREEWGFMRLDEVKCFDDLKKASADQALSKLVTDKRRASRRSASTSGTSGTAVDKTCNSCAASSTDGASDCTADFRDVSGDHAAVDHDGSSSCCSQQLSHGSKTRAVWKGKGLPSDRSPFQYGIDEEDAGHRYMDFADALNAKMGKCIGFGTQTFQVVPVPVHGTVHDAIHAREPLAVEARPLAAHVEPTIFFEEFQSAKRDSGLSVVSMQRVHFNDMEWLAIRPRRGSRAERFLFLNCMVSLHNHREQSKRSILIKTVDMEPDDFFLALSPMYQTKGVPTKIANCVWLRLTQEMAALSNILLDSGISPEDVDASLQEWTKEHGRVPSKSTERTRDWSCGLPSGEDYYTPRGTSSTSAQERRSEDRYAHERRTEERTTEGSIRGGTRSRNTRSPASPTVIIPGEGGDTSGCEIGGTSKRRRSREGYSKGDRFKKDEFGRSRSGRASRRDSEASRRGDTFSTKASCSDEQSSAPNWDIAEQLIAQGFKMPPMLVSAKDGKGAAIQSAQAQQRQTDPSVPQSPKAVVGALAAVRSRRKTLPSAAANAAEPTRSDDKDGKTSAAARAPEGARPPAMPRRHTKGGRVQTASSNALSGPAEDDQDDREQAVDELRNALRRALT